MHSNATTDDSVHSDISTDESGPNICDVNADADNEHPDRDDHPSSISQAHICDSDADFQSTDGCSSNHDTISNHSSSRDPTANDQTLDPSAIGEPRDPATKPINTQPHAAYCDPVTQPVNGARWTNPCDKNVDNCPGPQDGLPYGSMCIQAPDLTYACVPRVSCPPLGQSSVPTVTSSATPESGDLTLPPITPAPEPEPTTVPTSCTFSVSIPSYEECADDKMLAQGWLPTSVVGSSTFCAQISPPNKPRWCSGDAPGVCPSPQPGLPFGSICRVLNETLAGTPQAVYGCVQSPDCETLEFESGIITESDAVCEPSDAKSNHLGGSCAVAECVNQFSDSVDVESSAGASDDSSGDDRSSANDECACANEWSHVGPSAPVSDYTDPGDVDAYANYGRSCPNHSDVGAHHDCTIANHWNNPTVLDTATDDYGTSSYNCDAAADDGDARGYYFDSSTHYGNVRANDGDAAADHGDSSTHYGGACPNDCDTLANNGDACPNNGDACPKTVTPQPTTATPQPIR
ncbi:hypothetical protein SPRG_06231 [Saprolegnia parasitica CBS 223.65]|uniref:Uncharacterized protein n=1 Tax=Saprolegnia parasitica (strain CBS 223.65) TaxID=695850 RepID=A0A067CCK0_SAPPC|nr:hypothetical protein SPRG_06231 [Saprolegnia parasitica CBS 223.65]KDO28183.1 hypothetical protein SPRG_06231 [Saprolegnia parasitica CBS 223.65]|eukprot:XP_012201009.1 hypothetical protein SPRG_06231 [Saprolegnia parasitica CBS 223.65]